MKNKNEIYAELRTKSNHDLLKMVFDEEHPYQSTATSMLIDNLLNRIYQLEKEVLILSGQDTPKRKRTTYYYEDIELTDEILVDYIDSNAFTIYELEKRVGAKKNVLRGRYNRAKKRIQAQKCQNSEL
jgi:regulator of sigma D